MHRIVHSALTDVHSRLDDQNCAPQLAQNAPPESFAVPQLAQKATGALGATEAP